MLYDQTLLLWNVLNKYNFGQIQKIIFNIILTVFIHHSTHWLKDVGQ